MKLHQTYLNFSILIIKLSISGADGAETDNKTGEMMFHKVYEEAVNTVPSGE